MTHVCVSDLTIIGSDNGLSPERRQAIIRTNADILFIGPLGTNFSEILIAIYIFSFKKMHLKMSSGKWRPSCLGLNVLINKLHCLLWITEEAKTDWGGDGNEVGVGVTWIRIRIRIRNLYCPYFTEKHQGTRKYINKDIWIPTHYKQTKTLSENTKQWYKIILERKC